MITVDTLTVRDAVRVVSRLRDADFTEIRATIGDFDTHDLALAACASAPWAFVVRENHEPIACWGVMPTSTPWIGAAWCFGTDRLPRAIPSITRMQVDVRNALFAGGLHRLEIRSHVDHDMSHKWLQSEKMGFMREGLLKSYGMDGEDFVLYSFVKQG